MDPETGEEVDEDLGVVARVGRVTVAGLVRHMGERPAHLRLDGIRRQKRLGVHRIHVVDAVEERRLEAATAQGAGDDVEDDGPTEAANVDGPGRGLRVVDDLRPLNACGELVRPIHVSVRLHGRRRVEVPSGPPE
jgi:hypothetical protein